jgi:hypothetical protein
MQDLACFVELYGKVLRDSLGVYVALVTRVGAHLLEPGRAQVCAQPPPGQRVATVAPLK